MPLSGIRIKAATLVVFALAVAFALAACSGDNDAAAPVEPRAAAGQPAVLEFSFDGENCESTVPETIVVGRYDATFDNQTDSGSFVGTGGLREGFTVEEALALGGQARPFNTDDPVAEWLDPARVQFPGLIADPNSEARGAVDFSPGTYLFSCVFPDPADPASSTGLWITGGSFVVE